MYTYFVKSVDRVVDGDTIDISIDLGFDLTKKERVRLAGIDTPEKRTKDQKEKEMGYQATEFLEMHLMEATKLTVKTEKDGKFGRMLGWLYKTEEDEMFVEVDVVNVMIKIQDDAFKDDEAIVNAPDQTDSERHDDNEGQGRK